MTSCQPQMPAHLHAIPFVLHFFGKSQSILGAGLGILLCISGTLAPEVEAADLMHCTSENPNTLAVGQWEEDEFWESDTVTVKGKVYKRDVLGLKSPGAALFLALVPGSLVHGVGHFYAGHRRTGTILVIAEGLSIAMASAAFVMAFGDSESQEASIIFGYGGIFGFTGSWAYDVIAAPLVVRRDNKKILRNLSIRPYYAAKSDLAGHWGIGLQFGF